LGSAWEVLQSSAIGRLAVAIGDVGFSDGFEPRSNEALGQAADGGARGLPGEWSAAATRKPCLDGSRTSASSRPGAVICGWPDASSPIEEALQPKAQQLSSLS